MIKFVDVVVDLAYGDCGKGAITAQILGEERYNVVMRVSGGSNAGHTIYHEGKQIITHLVPCGFLYNTMSIIGNGCVLNVDKFLAEVAYIKTLGYNTDCIKIAGNCHIVTNSHIEEENKESRIGTTKQGIGPCYRDKYDRKGILAKDIPELKEYIIDLYEFLYDSSSSHSILVEGAQGHFLDVDYGDYPYVTSSHPGISSVLANYISYDKIRNVYGVIKPYETYVGAKEFQPKNSNHEKYFSNIVKFGSEFGATTGRQRQINFLNYPKLIEALCVTGKLKKLFISKMDVMVQSNFRDVEDNSYREIFEVTNYCGSIFQVFNYRGELYDLKTHENFIDYMKKTLADYTESIQFRYHPNQPVDIKE